MKVIRQTDSTQLIIRTLWVSLRLTLIFVASLDCAPQSVRSIKRPTQEATVSLVELRVNLLSGLSVAQDQFSAIYIIDAGRSGVLKLSASGDSLRSVQGVGRGEYEFNSPVDIDASLTNSVIIADHFNERLVRYTKELSFISEIGPTALNAREFGMPLAVAVDRSGTIFSLDGRSRTLKKIGPNGAVERSIGGYGATNTADGVLTEPLDIAVDDKDALYVLDRGGRSLVSYDKFGTLKQRVELKRAFRRIAISGDLVYLLADEGMLITSFAAESLDSITEFALSIAEPAVDLSVSRETIVLISQSRVYRGQLGTEGRR